MRARPWLAILAAVLAFFAALPVLAIVARGLSFGAGATWPHLASTVLPDYIANTLVLVFLVGVGAALGGTATGWLVARHRFPGSTVFEWALLLPLAMPAYVMAYAYTDLLQYAGPGAGVAARGVRLARGEYWFPDVRSLRGAAAMFVFALYPVRLPARAHRVPRAPAGAGRGRAHARSHRRQAFWRVALPLARPAIVGGIALALMETLADFGTVAYFAVQTFTTGIYRAWFSLGDRVAAAQLATGLAGIRRRRGRAGASVARRARSSTSARVKQASRHAREPLAGARAWLATTICAIPLVVGFLLPLLLLVRLARSDADAVLTPRFFEWAWNSFRVALRSPRCSPWCSRSLVAYAARLARGTRHAHRQPRAQRWATPCRDGDRGRRAAAARRRRQLARRLDAGAYPERTPRLLLTGTIVALVYAYLVRYFAVAWNGIEPGFARITPAMDDAARCLGVGTWRNAARVHAPLLSPQRGGRAAAGVRRRDEGAAGDVRAAAVQLRHAGGAGLPARHGRAARRSRRCRRWRSSRSAWCRSSCSRAWRAAG